MEQLNEIISILSLTMGVAWAAGINLYAAIATLGLLGASGNMTLPENLLILQEPIVIFAACTMYAIEFFADKVPGVDSGWDTIHTFIRIPAGALLAAGMVGDVNPAVALAAALVGGGIAAGTHATKAGTRLLINTSPEPVTNIMASLAEDAIVIGGLYLAWTHPAVFTALLFLFLLSLYWILPRLWRAVRSLGKGIARLFGGGKQKPIAATGVDLDQLQPANANLPDDDMNTLP